MGRLRRVVLGSIAWTLVYLVIEPKQLGAKRVVWAGREVDASRIFNVWGDGLKSRKLTVALDAEIVARHGETAIGVHRV